jgi:hypothetical protein
MTWTNTVEARDRAPSAPYIPSDNNPSDDVLNWDGG